MKLRLRKRILLSNTAICLLVPFIWINVNPKELTWDDFKGTPMAGNAALTTTYMDIETTDSLGRLWFKVTARFSPEESWTRTSNQEILEHERLHWAITRLVSLECQRALNKYQGREDRMAAKADAIYQRYSRKLTNLQQLYDKETKHSINIVVQKIWEKNILYDLAKLE